MLDTAIAASLVTTFGAGLNGPGQRPGGQSPPPGTTSAGQQTGFAVSGQTFSSAVTVSLSSAATTFLQTPDSVQAALGADQAQGNTADLTQRLTESVVDPDSEEPPAATSAEGQATDAQAARETISRANEEGPDGLTDAERQQVQSLRQTDAEIRRHEQAHAMVGGPYAGAPRYQFTSGPDGKQYAVSGQVSIDASSIPGDPQATIQKLRIVRRAALAPSDPSGQDQQVAATAQRGIIEARRELAEEQAAERDEAAAEAGREVIGENTGPFRNDTLASPVIEAALNSAPGATSGISAAGATLAFQQTASLTVRQAPQQSLSV